MTAPFCRRHRPPDRRHGRRLVRRRAARLRASTASSPRSPSASSASAPDRRARCWSNPGGRKRVKLASVTGSKRCRRPSTIATWNRNPADEEAMGAAHAPIWRRMIDVSVPHDLSASTVLDYGCNQGGFLRLLYDRHPFKAAVGIDIARESVARAELLKGHRPIEYKVADKAAAPRPHLRLRLQPRGDLPAARPRRACARHEGGAAARRRLRRRHGLPHRLEPCGRAGAS